MKVKLKKKGGISTNGKASTHVAEGALDHEVGVFIGHDSKFKIERELREHSRHEITAIASPIYYTHAKKNNALQTLRIVAEAGSILFTKKHICTKDSEAAVKSLVGSAAFQQWFELVTTIAVMMRKVPKTKQDAILADIRDIMRKHGCEDALIISRRMLPNANFWVQRHSKLNQMTNSKLDELLGTETTIKTVEKK